MIPQEKRREERNSIQQKKLRVKVHYPIPNYTQIIFISLSLLNRVLTFFLLKYLFKILLWQEK